VLFCCVLHVVRTIFGNVVFCELEVIILLLLFMFVADEGNGIVMYTAPHGDILFRTW
jgi:hypothetical protein